MNDKQIIKKLTEELETQVGKLTVMHEYGQMLVARYKTNNLLEQAEGLEAFLDVCYQNGLLTNPKTIN